MLSFFNESRGIVTFKKLELLSKKAKARMATILPFQWFYILRLLALDYLLNCFALPLMGCHANAFREKCKQPSLFVAYCVNGAGVNFICQMAVCF